VTITGNPNVDAVLIGLFLLVGSLAFFGAMGGDE
jgi:hypothetical protein